jgi:ATP-dependent Clp protease ATP-binding subunit ClpX
MAARFTDIDAIYKQLSADLEYGLKLVREKTGRNRFFLTRQALEAPEAFISQLLKKARNHLDEPPGTIHRCGSRKDRYAP